jgi:ribosomal protein L6P/L9E
LVTPKNPDDTATRAMWGTMARNIRQAITGVTAGFSIEMGMKGVGYGRAFARCDFADTDGLDGRDSIGDRI